MELISFLDFTKSYYGLFTDGKFAYIVDAEPDSDDDAEIYTLKNGKAVLTGKYPRGSFMLDVNKFIDNISSYNLYTIGKCPKCDVFRLVIKHNREAKLKKILSR